MECVLTPSRLRSLPLLIARGTARLAITSVDLPNTGTSGGGEAGLTPLRSTPDARRPASRSPPLVPLTTCLHARLAPRPLAPRAPHTVVRPPGDVGSVPSLPPIPLLIASAVAVEGIGEGSLET